LSKHLKVLLDAGYVSMTKSPSQRRSDARRLTWIKQTRTGRHAFDAHMEELRRIAAGSSDEIAAHQPAAPDQPFQPDRWRPAAASP
jgi:DNA-binding MarR family transcriptional regulator